MPTLLRDTYTVFARAMRMSLRNPAWLVISLMQPILYIVLFGPLLEPLAASSDPATPTRSSCPGSSSSWASSVPCSSGSD
jgi:ABC-2 type transport system permease protein